MACPEPQLKRSLSLPLVILYGIGTILGAGIYVLVGKVAGYAGIYTPVAFLAAAVIAALSAFSYAELVSRFPLSAGVAIYVEHGFNRATLSLLIGLLIVLIGTISTATMIRGLLGYLPVFVELPDTLVIITTTLVLGAVVIWGISQSVLIASVMTLFEVLGLVIIVWVARENLALIPVRLPELTPPFRVADWGPIMLGAFVAFYAFIGYEDMVNIAEEVVEAERAIPLGIITALVVTTLFYLLVSLAAVLSVAPAELAGSGAPLALIYEHNTGGRAWFISGISLAAVLNGALVQIIMASRILYGLSRRGRLPGWLGYIHPRTRTPVLATLLILAVVLLLTLLIPLVSLARMTSLITLVVFIMVNLALWRIKSRDTGVRPLFQVYPWVPVLGFLASLIFVILQLIPGYGG